MFLSIIIPTFNEARFIGNTLEFLLKQTYDMPFEIIVADGGSTDDTTSIASNFPVSVLQSPERGRAQQMNFAARFAKGTILFFVHADCLPPANFSSSIRNALNKGVDAGCFRYRFDSNKRMLQFNSFFNRFGGLLFRGGDQTLFIKKDIFSALGGFDESYIVMEDYDMVRRISKGHRFEVLRDEAMVSARKYDENSWLKVNIANAVAMSMYLTGLFCPLTIRNTYHRMIKHPKGR